MPVNDITCSKYNNLNFNAGYFFCTFFNQLTGGVHADAKLTENLFSVIS